MLNGTPVTRAYLRHDEIMAGGELRFTMQAMPNKAWAAERADRPYSASMVRSPATPADPG
jgi:putative alpha-1,2-mannosidase